MSFGAGAATGAAVVGFFWWLFKTKRLEIHQISTAALHDEDAMAMILEGWEALDMIDQDIERHIEEFGPPEPDWDEGEEG